MWLKLSFYLNTFFIFLSQYCAPKCLVWIRPKIFILSKIVIPDSFVTVTQHLNLNWFAIELQARNIPDKQINKCEIKIEIEKLVLTISFITNHNKRVSFFPSFEAAHINMVNVLLRIFVTLTSLLLTILCSCLIHQVQKLNVLLFSKCKKGLREDFATKPLKNRLLLMLPLSLFCNSSGSDIKKSLSFTYSCESCMSNGTSFNNISLFTSHDPTLL